LTGWPGSAHWSCRGGIEPGCVLPGGFVGVGGIVDGGEVGWVGVGMGLKVNVGGAAVGRFVGHVGGGVVGLLVCGSGCVGSGGRNGFRVGLWDEGVGEGDGTDVTAGSVASRCGGRLSAPFSDPLPSSTAVETPAPVSTTTMLAEASIHALLNRMFPKSRRFRRFGKLMPIGAVGSGALRR
jgi:hypothetical protein